jgi:hypothetical protein
VLLEEFLRVKAAHRIEECFEREGEAGLADYQVRNWAAWHRHQTFCGPRGSSTRRRGGEKIQTPALTSPQLRQWITGLIENLLDATQPAELCRRSTRWLRRNEEARFYHHRSRKLVSRLKNELRL